ncbi:hypothetical protein FBZ85_101450 [Azospirillum brasilense]|uniref:hypothetical protein n=1 Tax=Azospirillum baldaniorum TaxID=1064539 RepID=UPI001013D6F8|nr:hypothetical protein [Azospirillum baldaniorum]TWA83701.1 hypothetical protein FBZ85_101450 [Azospirillum brasilense]
MEKMKYLIPPMLVVDELPEGEREAAIVICDLLSALSTHVSDFESAVMLLDYSESIRLSLWNESSEARARPDILKHGPEFYLEKVHGPLRATKIPSSWSVIAAKDAAMTVYHAHYLISEICALLQACSDLRSIIDQSKLSEATEIFNNSFPKAKQIRNTVAHSAEILRDKQKNGFRGKTGNGWLKKAKGSLVTIVNTLMGRDLHMTRKGELLSLPVTQQSLTQIRLSIEAMFDAFEAAAQITRERYKSTRLSESPERPSQH